VFEGEPGLGEESADEIGPVLDAAEPVPDCAGAPAWLAGKGGRPSAYCMRDVVDGIRYLTHNGAVWRALPADFPAAWTLYYWAYTTRQSTRRSAACRIRT
jgi:hypothetical protein